MDERPSKGGDKDGLREQHPGAHGGVESPCGPDGWHRGRAHDDKVSQRLVDRRLPLGPVADDNRLPDRLAQGGECRSAEDDLVSRLDRMSRENGRAESGVCGVDERRDSLAVDLDVCVAESGPRGDVGIVLEKAAYQGRTLSPPSGSMAKFQFHPYSAGWDTSVLSPLAKVTVATTTVTVSTDPTSTERTGTADRP